MSTRHQPRVAGSPDRTEFRELYPGHRAVDLAEVYAPTIQPGRDRNVRVNMISTVDGATTVGGTSGGLGGPADHEVFGAIRSFADVIVVGAATMRDEAYGPARLDDAKRQARLARGQTPVPAIAVITRSAHLDWELPFFTDAEVRPIVITDASAPRPPPTVADVIAAGDGDGVDLGQALDQLVERGSPQVLVEGGPTINGLFAALDAVDELCLTCSPQLVVGSSHRIFAGADLPAPVPLTLASVVAGGSCLFFRYERARAARAG